MVRTMSVWSSRRGFVRILIYDRQNSFSSLNAWGIGKMEMGIGCFLTFIFDFFVFGMRSSGLFVLFLVSINLSRFHFNDFISLN